MKKQNNLHDYNIHLKEYARKLRKNSTKAEIKVWVNLLRAKKMKGYPFLRQRAILRYIADFYCKPLKLVIELDGFSHENEEVQKKEVAQEETDKICPKCGKAMGDATMWSRRRL